MKRLATHHKTESLCPSLGKRLAGRRDPFRAVMQAPEHKTQERTNTSAGSGRESAQPSAPSPAVAESGCPCRRTEIAGSLQRRTPRILPQAPAAWSEALPEAKGAPGYGITLAGLPLNFPHVNFLHP